MNKYLDLEGLSLYDSKIKNFINAKTNSTTESSLFDNLEDLDQNFDYSLRISFVDGKPVAKWERIIEE